MKARRAILGGLIIAIAVVLAFGLIYDFDPMHWVALYIEARVPYMDVLTVQRTGASFNGTEWTSHFLGMMFTADPEQVTQETWTRER